MLPFSASGNQAHENYFCDKKMETFLYPSFFEINQSKPCGEFLLERFVLHAVMCKEVIFQ